MIFGFAPPPPAHALLVILELPQPIDSTPTISKPGLVDELHYGMLSWASSFCSFVLGAPFSKHAPILDVTTVGTIAAAYDSSVIPIGSVLQVAPSCRELRPLF